MVQKPKKEKRKIDPKPIIVKFLMFVILVILVGYYAGKPLLEKYSPSREAKDLNEWFEVSGDEVKIYLDNTVERDYLGLSRDGEIYLPYDYIFNTLNERFYFNYNEELLSYTLPDEVLDFSFDTPAGQSGAGAFTYDNDTLFISLGLVEEYTDICHEAFTTDDVSAKRVFIYHGGESYDQAVVTAKKGGYVRTTGDKKAPVLTSLENGRTMVVTDILSGWSRVVTDDGIIGYIDNDSLEAIAEPKVYEHSYTEPEVPYVMLDEKVVMGWMAVYVQGGGDSPSYYNRQSGGVLNVIVPQWLQISDAEGTLIDFSSASYVDEAHALGISIFAGVDNVSQLGGINDFSTGEYFGDTARRRSFIAELITKAEEYGYDGFNLDFESIAESAGQAYTQFFRELSVECHKHGLTLSICTDVPYSYNSYYSIGEQGVFADYVCIMAYDEHYEGGDPGPIASLSYTEYAITASIDKGVPAEHLVIGVPFYTRVWKTDTEGHVSSDSLGMVEAASYVSENGLNKLWDEENGCYYASRTLGSGQLREVWLEDETSIGLKVEKMRAYDVGGVAAWRLGIESQKVWPVMDLNSENAS